MTALISDNTGTVSVSNYADAAAYFSAIDLSQLSPPELIEQLEYTSVFTVVMADFIARDPYYAMLLESDPAVKVLEVGSYREHLIRQAFNDRAQQLLIAYAVGENLDHLGAFYGVYRQMVTPADNTTRPPTPAVYQSDDAFRRDIQLAPEAFSCAGPAGAYLFHTYRAHPGVQNAVVYNNASGLVAPGVVLVVIKVDPQFASADVVTAVRTRLFRDDVKPLTDQIQVKVATPALFDVVATLNVRGGPDGLLIRSQARDRFNTEMEARAKIGAMIPLSAIYSSLNGLYIESIDLPSPAANFQPGLQEFAQVNSFSLSVNKL